MNYLGHAVLSFGNAQLLCGNMMGDFVKGVESEMNIYPPGIKLGLLLHRKIDSYTDAHDSIRSLKKIFREQYGLYSGAVVDTLMDHFIANDASLFPSEDELTFFVQDVYDKLGSQRQYFPIKFEPYYISMIQHNWLFHYRNEDGVKKSLHGLMRKAKHIKEVDTAFKLLQLNKPEMEQHYQVFIKDIFSFVKNEFEAK